MTLNNITGRFHAKAQRRGFTYYVFKTAKVFCNDLVIVI